MADELPSGDKAVYAFLEILAFCFALASVDAFVARHWFGSIAYLLVAVLFFVGGIKWPEIRLRATRTVGQRDPAVKQSNPALPDDKPPTLLDVFKQDFSNTLKASDQDEYAISIKWHDGGTTNIKRQVYMDFPAKTKFIGFYIPMPTPPSADLSGRTTFSACLQLIEIDAVGQAFDHFAKQVAVLAGRDGQMTSIQDLTF